MSYEDSVAGGASTMSRQPGRRPIPAGSLGHSISGKGCRVKMSSGAEFIDLPMGQHGALFGYAPGYLESPLRLAAINGEVTSYPPQIEFTVASKLCNWFGIDRVRFGKNGSDCCAAAVRLARAVTGRSRIAAFGYHGFAAEFVHPPQNRGVPQVLQDFVEWFEWGDEAAMENAAQGAACIIVEVPPTDDFFATQAFLERCKEVAKQEGALFILDEVVTGFRLSMLGAAGYYKVTPDLYVWGKAMANGHPVAALGGSAKLMDEFQNGVFFSGTFFDDPYALTAALATLQRIEKMNPDLYEHIFSTGKVIKDFFNALAKMYGIQASCVGQPPRTVFQFSDEKLRRKFCSLALSRNVLFDRPNFTTWAIRELDLQSILSAIEFVIPQLSER